MKYMFASDVHGSAYYCRLMLEKYKEEQAERGAAGRSLYHGPRKTFRRNMHRKRSSKC